MRYDDSKLREALAAEYVLGTLRGRARRRFERLSDARPDWREEAEAWSARLNLLAEAVPPVEPPPRLWRAIESRLDGPRPLPGAAARTLPWWKGLAALSTAFALALAVYVGVRQPEPAPLAQVAVLADPGERSAWVLTLAERIGGGTEIRAAVLAGLVPVPDKAFELWMLPGAGAAPVSLGLLPQQGSGTLPLPPAAAALLARAEGLAVSLEPPGGSASGRPTGPVLYQGRLTRL